MAVLVLGGYGFIGREICRRLHQAGHEVVGLGRSPEHVPSDLKSIRWQWADVSTLGRPEDWIPHLADIQGVVNAAGALQDGARDDVAAVQHRAMVALIEACQRTAVDRFVQISAAGVSDQSDTEFFRSKAQADQYLSASKLRWTILRPGLVIGADAYGGTALLRSLAAFPWVQPLVYGDRPVQCVAMDDLTDLVADVVAGNGPERGAFDVVEDHPSSLEDVVGTFRAWLGFPKARATISVPAVLARAVGRVADGLGHLGWRSPLRTTALKVMAAGVTGDPEPLRRHTGRSLRSLQEAFDAMPSTRQERWFARLSLLLPLLIAGLGLFWLVSGMIGLLRLDAAVALLLAAGLSSSSSTALVVVGSLVDMALGIAIFHRRWARPACLTMIAVTAAYLLGATVWVPQLWPDPLGPLVKTVPAALLALVTYTVLEER